VRLIVATRSSGPPASGKIIKEMPGSVASGTPCIIHLHWWCTVKHKSNLIFVPFLSINVLIWFGQSLYTSV